MTPGRFEKLKVPSTSVRVSRGGPGSLEESRTVAPGTGMFLLSTALPSIVYSDCAPKEGAEITTEERISANRRNIPPTPSLAGETYADSPVPLHENCPFTTKTPRHKEAQALACVDLRAFVSFVVRFWGPGQEGSIMPSWARLWRDCVSWT